jgi:GT2 family glycosyltransferase
MRIHAPQRLGGSPVEPVLAPVSLAAGRSAPPDGRPRVFGKFLYAGTEKLFLRGVTYGPFAPDEAGCAYGSPQRLERDLDLMREHGINALRVYTVPPRWLLDLAYRHEMWVMVGLPWEQHIAFLDDARRAAQIEAQLRAGVRCCAGHPAVLCFVIGNEIPSPIVRWHERRAVERFLHRLYDAAKAEDPDALVTYVNYPSTEYLQLPFLDFECFNVYLEAAAALEAYVARLQNIAGDRPLVIGELGLDSLRHGPAAQATALARQVKAVFAGGGSGAFIFAWTDEWHRGGEDVQGWEFGLTTRQREPRAALLAVQRAFAETPFPSGQRAPFISVVVCTCNGSRTMRDTLEGLRQLDYPRFEVIVVDDGSTDGVAGIVAQYDVRLIRTPNRGLSSARNTGMLAAHGEIIAYLDDDARPDPHWLSYLALTFASAGHAAVGGPNLAPAGDGWIADCVARAPGGPIHVLLTDRIAEHVPGCNLALRRQVLLEIGGFDPRFRVAGDDVDICWRIQARGWTIGFSPAALVWHHRRNSVRAYLKQQLNYGRAEALLERKWPGKYNALGHASWTGRIYGGGGALPRLGWRSWRIYQGTWGSAAFQSIYHTAPGTIASLPTTPEWYLLILLLAGASASSLAWAPMVFALPLLGAAVMLPLVHATLRGIRAMPPESADRASRRQRWGRRGLVVLLHLLQPAARLIGRLRSGLSPWRFRRAGGMAFPRARSWTFWTERWQAPAERLVGLEASLRALHAITLRGGDFDAWDLEVLGGIIGAVRLKMTVEEHGQGRQLFRFRAWPRCPWSVAGAIVAASTGALAAWRFGVPAAAIAALAAGVLLLLLAAQEWAVAMGILARALGAVQTDDALKGSEP